MLSNEISQNAENQGFGTLLQAFCTPYRVLLVPYPEEGLIGGVHVVLPKEAGVVVKKVVDQARAVLYNRSNH